MRPSRAHHDGIVVLIEKRCQLIFAAMNFPGHPRNMVQQRLSANTCSISLTTSVSSLTVVHFFQNLPTPNRTCTVFNPGLKSPSPAFDMCR
jgi:hypothetical protein